MQHRLLDLTRSLYLPDVDKLQYSLKRIVFGVIYPEHYNARYIIDHMDNKEADGEEVGKLATTVIMSLIADWMVKNVEVTVGNVKV